MFERIFQVRPAYDFRDADPSRNYGIHNAVMVFVVKKGHNAIQWVVSTGWYTKSAEAHLRTFPKREYREQYDYRPWATDIGYHAILPQYDGQHKLHEHCEYTGGACYYDGSSLHAEDFVDGFLQGGTDWLWPILEQVYRARFEGGEYPDLTPPVQINPRDRNV